MSNYVNENGIFNHQKWQRNQYFKEATDPVLKSLRTVVKGEQFPELDKWWEYESEDIMAYVYWHQDQLPPTGTQFDKEWKNIVKQLHAKYPIPVDVLPSVDLDKQSMDAIMQDVPRAENIKDVTMNEDNFDSRLKAVMGDDEFNKAINPPSQWPSWSIRFGDANISGVEYRSSKMFKVKARTTVEAIKKATRDAGGTGDDWMVVIIHTLKRL